MGNPGIKLVTAALPSEPAPQPGARLGWLVGVTSGGRPLVEVPGGAAGPVEATSAIGTDRSALESHAEGTNRMKGGSVRIN